MTINGRLLQQFSGLICDTFDDAELTQLLRFQMDLSLDDVAAPGRFEMRVFDLLMWAEKQGRLAELAKAIGDSRQYRMDVRRVAQELVAGRVDGPVECSFCPNKPLAGPPLSRGSHANKDLSRSLNLRSDTPVEVVPQPPPIKKGRTNDPQKGRWGGQAERNGRRLEGRLIDEYDETFLCDLIVRSTDGTPVEPPVVFYLHSTFPRSSYHIRKVRDDGTWAMLSEVEASGAFTAGVQTHTPSGWTMLEYDLVNLPGLKAKFRNR